MDVPCGFYVELHAAAIFRVDHVKYFRIVCGAELHRRSRDCMSTLS